MKLIQIFMTSITLQKSFYQLTSVNKVCKMFFIDFDVDGKKRQNQVISEW